MQGIIEQTERAGGVAALGNVVTLHCSSIRALVGVKWAVDLLTVYVWYWFIASQTTELYLGYCFPLWTSERCTEYAQDASHTFWVVTVWVNVILSALSLVFLLLTGPNGGSKSLLAFKIYVVAHLYGTALFAVVALSMAMMGMLVLVLVEAVLDVLALYCAHRRSNAVGRAEAGAVTLSGGSVEMRRLDGRGRDEDGGGGTSTRRPYQVLSQDG